MRTYAPADSPVSIDIPETNEAALVLAKRDAWDWANRSNLDVRRGEDSLKIGNFGVGSIENDM